MAPINYSNLPTKMIMENDILGDILYTNDRLTTILEKLEKKLNHLKDARDFFFVLLDSQTKSVKGIITLLELKELLKFVNEELKKTNKNLPDIEIHTPTYCKKPVLIKSDNTITEVLSIFDSNQENILIVVNDKNVYIGKIRRTTLKDKLDELIKSITS
ncbi:MAG: CBS domain-containing protein [Candidatus Woesearchaeota archaeon]|nr:CBS domain-containing protein [Candidatus Woesearchaeota archaeon]